jgi:hypothetical protein
MIWCEIILKRASVEVFFLKKKIVLTLPRFLKTWSRNYAPVVNRVKPFG